MRDLAGDFGGRVDFSPCSQGGKGLGGRAGHGDDEQGPLFRSSATTAPAASRRRSSLKAGIVAPSVMLRKLAAYRRHNQPDLALQELGRIERTLFMLDGSKARNCADAAMPGSTRASSVETGTTGSTRIRRATPCCCGL